KFHSDTKTDFVEHAVESRLAASFFQSLQCDFEPTQRFEPDLSLEDFHFQRVEQIERGTPPPDEAPAPFSGILDTLEREECIHAVNALGCARGGGGLGFPAPIERETAFGRATSRTGRGGRLRRCRNDAH